MIPKDKTHSHPEDAHDSHVVQGHPHVLGVIERWNLNLPGLPGQEGPKHLKFNYESAVLKVMGISTIRRPL